MWFGGKAALPSSLSTIGLTPGALTSGTGGLAVNLPAVSAGAGGFGSGLSSWILPTLGLGLGADLLSGFNKASMEEKTKEALENATNRYVGEVTWTPEKRGEYMKGVQSELQTMLQGRRNRAGASLAARGTGGGEYERLGDEAYSEAMGEAVKKLYSTYEPSNLSPEVLRAWATAASPTQGGGWRFLDSLANLAGTAGSQMLDIALLRSLLYGA